jgi:hypothetical protein
MHWVITKPERQKRSEAGKESRKNYFAYRDKRWKTHKACDVCFVPCTDPERRIECYVIMENDLLGTNKKPRTSTGKGLRREKKREKELLRNIIHQLGMLSWDSGASN